MLCARLETKWLIKLYALPLNSYLEFLQFKKALNLSAKAYNVTKYDRSSFIYVFVQTLCTMIFRSKLTEQEQYILIGR